MMKDSYYLTNTILFVIKKSAGL